jgi:elongation factor P--beta-lysine ligase
MTMDCSTSTDYRFPIQQVSEKRWRQATAANLAADYLAGYDLWVSAFTDGRPDWHEHGAFLRMSSTDQLAEYVATHRQESLAFVVMMLTGACNADCPICFTDRRRKAGEMTPELRDRVLHEAADLGASYVYVPGEGEPTIDRGWWQFLDSCRDARLHAIVFTNGLVFSDPLTSRKFWDCEPEETVARVRDYPVSFYTKMWSTQPQLVGEMLRVDPAKYHFTDYDGDCVPVGMARLLDELPRDRLGIEVVVERRNADEVVDRIVPFARRHGLAQIVELLQHNGRTLGNASWDPTPRQVSAVTPHLSPTSCTVATCKAVVTSRGYLSPRIAILEGQIPQPRRQVGEKELWDLLHSTDYLVQRRYEQSCLCESEPVAQAQLGAGSNLVLATSVVPPSLAGAAESPVSAVQPSAADVPAEVPAAEVPAAPGTVLAEPAAEPVADEVAHLPETTVERLLSGETVHGERVLLVGRAQPAGAGVLTLADGPATVIVSGVDVPAGSWVRIRGTWDAAIVAVRAEHVDVLKQPSRPPSGPLAAEFAAIRDPQLLAPIVDRARMMRLVRRLLERRGYLEVCTPMLATAGEMCMVNQVLTEPIGGRRFYLRTDPEEYLKRYLSAGLPAVFEISTNVRADPVDEIHLMEFQSLEYYQRLMTFEESIELAEDVILGALREVGGEVVTWRQLRLDTRKPVVRMPFAALFESATGVDVTSEACATADGLATALRDAGFGVHVGGELARWRRAWLEEALDRHVLPRLRQPMWVTHFPADLALSARLDPTDPARSLRAELYLPGKLELAHVYENLTDGTDLRARYDARRSHRVAGGLTYVPTNEALMASAEAGMPPMAGGAIGLDRVLMVARGDAEVGRGTLFGREGVAVPPAPKSLCGSGGCGSCSGGCH